MTTASDPFAWMREGDCLGADAELFYPGQGEDTAPAKAICRTCPVKETCAEHAIVTAEKYGIWGGLSEKERRRERRARRNRT